MFLVHVEELRSKELRSKGLKSKGLKGVKKVRYRLNY
jgi:hypothetical protein